MEHNGSSKLSCSIAISYQQCAECISAKPVIGILSYDHMNIPNHTPVHEVRPSADLSCMYLARHELESVLIIIIAMKCRDRLLYMHCSNFSTLKLINGVTHDELLFDSSCVSM